MYTLYVSYTMSASCMLSCFSHVPLCTTLWTAALQASLYMGFLASKLEWVAMPLFQGIEPTFSMSTCIGRRVLYQQHYLGSPPYTICII